MRMISDIESEIWNNKYEYNGSLPGNTLKLGISFNRQSAKFKLCKGALIGRPKL